MNREQLLQKVDYYLKEVYGSDYTEDNRQLFIDLIERWEKADWENIDELTEENVYFITYGDAVYEKGTPTLKTLQKFLNRFAKGYITDVHLLPMFPYTSDDGFSVTDYMKINPTLGDWDDIHALSRDFRLMFDFVANHISKSSAWFQGYLHDDPKYENYFIPENKEFDTSQVIRPRTSPLFHTYEGKNGTKTAWTTFSEDQVDLNFAHFPVLVEMTNIILEYAHRGATSIRLDAIGFLWKKSGTGCMHLPETHAIIKLWRTLLDYFKKGTQIITETNVPHEENISYFGSGDDEAHMVYQFSMPPLVLYTFSTFNSEKLTAWAKTIHKVSDTATYFNFLASHDGIGMRPTEGILTEEERQMLVEKVLANGGRVSYKNNPDGTQSVYELNINYSDALINQDVDTTEELQVQKMLAAHSILFSFIGVPAIYYHSYLGSRNDYKGLEESGINRRINREKLEYDKIIHELTNDKRRQAIFNGMNRLIELRKNESAFSPFAEQQVLDFGPDVFALVRENKETDEKISFIVNVTPKTIEVATDFKGTDLFSGTAVDGKITLAPYQYMWIK